MALTFNVDEVLFERLLDGTQFRYSERLEELCMRTRPLVRQEERLYYVAGNVPIGTVWPMLPLSPDPVEDLVELTKIHTLHRQGGYRLQFRPSVEEVIAFVPRHLEERLTAFETVGPQYVGDIDCQLRI